MMSQMTEADLKEKMKQWAAQVEASQKKSQEVLEKTRQAASRKRDEELQKEQVN